MRTAIIGTAGANKDIQKMSKLLYIEMFNESLVQLAQLVKDPGQQVDLVSGVHVITLPCFQSQRN